MGFSFRTLVNKAGKNKEKITVLKLTRVGGHQCAKVMAELSLRNSANFFRTLAIRKPERAQRIAEADCLPKTQLLANINLDVLEVNPAQ